MTNDIDKATDTEIQKFKVDDAYKDAALKQVRALVEGNKCDPKNVVLEKFEGEVVNFQAETMIKVSTKVSNKIVAGRVQGPVLVDSPDEAEKAISQAYLTLFDDAGTQRQIRDVILARPDQGFCVGDELVPFPFWKKEFVLFEPCHACRANGSVKCLPCDGHGQERCSRCNGSGLGHCSHCHGAQMVAGPNNSQIQCPVCHGNGRTSCVSCAQSGTITCRTCRGSGSTSCPTCSGNAWNSHIFIVELEGRVYFDYPRDKLPDKVVEMIQKHGAKISDYATIEISQEQDSVVNAEDEDKADEQEDEDKKKYLRVPVLYRVNLPYGHVEYTIKNNTYYTFMFGKNATLTHVSPFLDDLLRNGLRKLQDAAEERGDVADNLRQAAEFKTLKQSIFFTTKHSVSRAKTLLRDANPLGLSDDAIESSVNNADIALKCVTKQPRAIGLGFSALFNVLLFAIYILSPLRSALTSSLGSHLHPIFDCLVLFIGGFVGSMIIQSFVQAALKSVFNTIMPKLKSARPTAKIGSILYYNYGLSVVLFFIVLEISRHINVYSVSWYINLF